MEITVLCKVVDNFGDAGFAVRLCRALTEERDDVHLRVVCDDVSLLLRLEPSLAPSITADGETRVALFDWSASDVCAHEFSRRPPRIILECFQCGRPEWLDAILFDSTFSQTVQIVNIEYLTAEDWADGFHLLKSGTRAANIKKVNFMPGLTHKTGGLILDKHFLRCKEDTSYARRVVSQTLGEGFVEEGFDHAFKVLLFSYERDLGFLASALKRLSCVHPVMVFIAAGAGYTSAQAAFREAGVEYTPLPFLPQRVWDALVSQMDFAFVRGEDSFARTCLLGKPFVWQAYPQQGQYHLVKLAAFLQKLSSAATIDTIDVSNAIDTSNASATIDTTNTIGRFSFLYNWEDRQEPSYDVWDALSRCGAASFLHGATAKSFDELLEQEALSLLEAAARGQLTDPFASLSRTLLANGNLAHHLLAYLDTLKV